MNIIISSLLGLPFFGSLILLMIPKHKHDTLRFFSLFLALITFLVSVFMWFLFDKSSNSFQFCEVFYFNFFEVLLGIDGLSFFLFYLQLF